MKLKLKASAYCNMVERDGQLVLLSEKNPNKVIMVVGKVGVNSSLLKYVTKYPSANTKYAVDEEVYCCNKLLGTTHYRPVVVGANGYTYTDSVAVCSSLA